jgi:hypothetical protein
MSPGDMVLLSLDGLHAAIGRVTVHSIRPESVTVASKKAVLIERYERQWRQLNGLEPSQPPPVADAGDATQQPAGTQRRAKPPAVSGGSGGGGAAQAQVQPPRAPAPAPWRLDKDEIASMSATLRTNLLKLCMDPSSRAARLRALIIDQAAPRLHGLAAAGGEGGGGGAGPGGGAGLRLRLRLEAAEAYLSERGGGLNEEQAAAVRGVAGAEDYALVLGMPGGPQGRGRGGVAGRVLLARQMSWEPRLWHAGRFGQGAASGGATFAVLTRHADLGTRPALATPTLGPAGALAPLTAPPPPHTHTPLILLQTKWRLGTGKTSTIAAAIRALSSTGARVLVSAYTNSAVDNILLKLAGLGVDFIRLGRQATAHPGVHRYMPGGAAYPDRTTAALGAAMDAVRGGPRGPGQRRRAAVRPDPGLGRCVSGENWAARAAAQPRRHSPLLLWPARCAPAGPCNPPTPFIRCGSSACRACRATARCSPAATLTSPSWMRPARSRCRPC